MILRRSPEMLRFGGMVAIFVVSGLAIAYLVLPPAPDDPDKPRPAPPLRVAGMVVPPGDAPALASAIQGMHAISEAERAEMGRRGREAVIARFSRAAGADRFLDLLKLVALRSPRRSVDD